MEVLYFMLMRLHFNFLTSKTLSHYTICYKLYSSSNVLRSQKKSKTYFYDQVLYYSTGSHAHGNPSMSMGVSNCLVPNHHHHHHHHAGYMVSTNLANMRIRPQEYYMDTPHM